MFLLIAIITARFERISPKIEHLKATRKRGWAREIRSLHQAITFSEHWSIILKIRTINYSFAKNINAK